MGSEEEEKKEYELRGAAGDAPEKRRALLHDDSEKVIETVDAPAKTRSKPTSDDGQSTSG